MWTCEAALNLLRVKKPYSASLPVPEGAGCCPIRSALIGLSAPSLKKFCPQRIGVIHKKSMKTVLFHDFGG